MNVTPYDTDGNTSNWSTAEQDVVRDVWARVAEDYAPFDVDVTTQAPAAGGDHPVRFVRPAVRHARR